MYAAPIATDAAPIGLQLARTARVVSQAFERAMGEAGGSAAAWQVLLLVRSRAWSRQSEMAEAMGITGATLTHHLNALERQGLVRRWRDDGNRRLQLVELTDEGVALFDRLRAVAVRHDARLRAQLGDDEIAQLAELLGRLRAAVETRPRSPVRSRRRAAEAPPRPSASGADDRGTPPHDDAQQAPRPAPDAASAPMS